MATVIVTKDLRRRVLGRIQNMRTKEQFAICPKVGTNISVDASHLFNLLSWGKHYHLMSLIPQEGDWLHTPNAMTLRVDAVGGISCRINIVGLTSARARPTTNRYTYNDVQISLEDLRALPEETVGRTEALEYFDSFVEHQAIALRWGKIESDVDGFLQKCRSVNEGVKLFPNLRMYLHPDDIDRLDTVKTGSKAKEREDIVASLDVAELTSAAISVKLMGGI